MAVLVPVSARSQRKGVRPHGAIPSWAVVATAASVSVAACVDLFVAGSHAGAMIAVVAATLLQWRVLQHATGELVPLAGLVVAVVNTIGITGYLFFEDIADGAAVSAVLPTTDEVYRRAAVIFAVASFSMWLGALIPARRGATTTLAVPTIGRRLNPAALLVVAVTPFMTTVYARGAMSLLSREGYGTGTNSAVLQSAGQLLLPVGFLAAALIAFGGRGLIRQFGVVSCFAYALLYFAMGSRALALLPFLLLAAALAAGRRPRTRKIVAAFVATAFFLQMPLALRSGGADAPAGLMPYASRIATDPGTAFVTDASLAVGNVLFSVPLAGVVAQSPTVTAQTFLTSVNPLPGSLTGWEHMSGDLRVNANTPYSGLGELGALGIGWLAAYCLLVGAVLTCLQRVIRELPTSRSLIAFVGCAGLTALFAASLMQYNLRSDTRLIWYAITFVVVMRFWPAAGQWQVRGPRAAQRNTSRA